MYRILSSVPRASSALYIAIGVDNSTIFKRLENAGFRVRNGLVTPRERSVRSNRCGQEYDFQKAQKRGFSCEKQLSIAQGKDFAKQMQVTLIGKWSAGTTTAEADPVSIKLEALLERNSQKQVLQNYSRIS